MSRVLLTDGNYKHSLSLARQFSELGYTVDALGSKFGANRFSKYLHFVGDQFNSLDDPENLQQLIRILSENDYSLLVPVGAISVEFISRNQEILGNFTKLVLPSRTNLSKAFDKFEMCKQAEFVNVNFPVTYLAQDFLFHNLNSSGQFCIKNRFEFGSKIQTKYFDSTEKVIEFLNLTESSKLADLIVQERIYGPGEAFFGLYQNGNLVEGYTHRRVREIPISGGSSTCAISTNSADVFTAGKSMLDSLSWHGVAMVEFKRDEANGTPVLMEINPKFWGSLDLGIALGINFAEFLVKASQSEEISKSRIEVRRPQVKFQWPLDGDFYNLRHRSVTKDILFDFINPKVKKNLFLTDPLPLFVRSFIGLMRLILKTPVGRFFSRYYSRLKLQGLRITIWRFIEETFGVPIFSARAGSRSIYLGPQISRLGKWKLLLMGFKSSVSLQSEFNDLENGLDLKNHLYLPCVEYQTLNSSDLHKGVSFISDQIKSGGKVYIHCREGRSRAAYLAVAYLIQNGTTIENAISIIRSERPFVDLLPNQQNSIEETFHELLESFIEKEGFGENPS
jgi:predicted ATP-grasp superfamily ATP-dependent carboligase